MTATSQRVHRTTSQELGPGDCFSTCVYISVLLLGMLLFIVGIALITVAYVAFETRNSMFFVLGVMMIVSALAVIIVAFYIRVRIIGDMDAEMNYENDQTAQDTIPPIRNYVPSVSSVLSRAYSPTETSNEVMVDEQARQHTQIMHTKNANRQYQDDMRTASPSSSQLCLVPQQGQQSSDYVYENLVALADDTLFRLSSIVPVTSSADGHHVSPVRDIGQPVTAQDTMRLPYSTSPTHIRRPCHPSDLPPAYSQYWQLPIRQESITSANDEIPPSYEESLNIPVERYIC